jgi:FkbM family methyltransferase
LGLRIGALRDGMKRMKDYSQNGEQKVILNYFGGEEKIRGLRNMTLLDCGANDGVLLSNSRALIELGWNAVLVEPAEIAFSKLMQNSLCLGDGPTEFFTDELKKPVMNVFRGGIKCVQAAITPTDGAIDFWSSGTHLKQGDTDLLSTTKEAEIARWKKSGESFTKTTVRGITFATLMKETGLTRADFISIDAEGADYSILEQIDLTAVGCRLLCVEVNARGDAEFTAYAAKHGMRLLWKNFENRIYAR